MNIKARTVHIQRSQKIRKGGEWYTTPPKPRKSDRYISLTDAFVKRLEEHKRHGI
jgi:hypothetical protein